MAKTRMLQTHFQVAYEVRGEKLSPNRVNPLLKRFSELLKDFKIEEKDYKAVVTLVGDSIFQEVDTRKLKCSSHLTIEIFDSRPSADISKWGLNHSEGAQIHRGLKEISLVDGKYSHRIDIKIMDTYEGSEPPMSHPQSSWPQRRF